MTLEFKCSDMGISCPYVAKAESEDELMKDIAVHAKNVHDYTDEQLIDPEMIKQIKDIIIKK